MRGSNSIVVILFIFILHSFPIFSQQGNNSSQSIAQKKGNSLFKKAVSFHQIDIDSTEHYIRAASQQFKIAEDWENHVLCLTSISTSLYNKGNFLDSYEYAKRGLKLAENFLPKTSYARNAIQSNLSSFLTDRGQYKKAIENLEQIYQTEKQQNNSQQQRITLGLIGYNYLHLGDYEEALKHYKQSLELCRDTVGYMRYTNEANMHNRIGRCHFENNMLDSAIISYQNSLRIISNPKAGTSTRKFDIELQSHLDLAKAYLRIEKFDLVLFHVNMAKSLSNKTHSYNQGLTNELLGNYYLKKKNHELAILHFTKSKQLAEEEFKAYRKHRLIAEKDILIAQSYFQNQHYHEALNYFQLALEGLNNDSLVLELFENPKLEQVFAKNIALQALSGKAKSQFYLFKKEGNQQYLIQSIQTFRVATNLIQRIRQDYLAEGSKQNLLKNVHSIYEQSIDVALKCFEMTKDSTYLVEAFSYSESNKAILLLESINENSAKAFAQIPLKLLSLEEELKIEIITIQKAINELKQKSEKNNLKLKDLNKKLFENQKKYNSLIATFEKNYPRYYQHKYSTQLASVKNVQSNILKTNQSLIEYFWGDKNIYIFAISKHNVKALKIEKQIDLITAIQSITDFVKRPPSSKNSTQDYNNFTRNSNFIFESLIHPILPPSSSELIIVPDDILYYLPFEVLVANKPDSSLPNYSIKNLDYLIKNYKISYSYSATLLLNSLEKKEVNHVTNFVGFAPSFKSSLASNERICDDEQLYSLNCNEDEIQEIQKIIGGKIHTSKKANIENFQLASKQCKILHLATHACIDNENPLFNKIHLADDYISINDLYNLSFDADLAVLSACNTGSGQLSKGEGVMSLSRGFIHSGCPSVIMSLWSVDDCATSEIMVNFYNHLKTEKTKSEALQAAKIDFINTAKKDQQHPYYWAAFVHIGNDAPLNFSNESPILRLIFFLFGTALLFILFFSSKSIKTILMKKNT